MMAGHNSQCDQTVYRDYWSGNRRWMSVIDSCHYLNPINWTTDLFKSSPFARLISIWVWCILLKTWWWITLHVWVYIQLASQSFISQWINRSGYKIRCTKHSCECRWRFEEINCWSSSCFRWHKRMVWRIHCYWGSRSGRSKKYPSLNIYDYY